MDLANDRSPGRHSKAHFSHKDTEKRTSNRPLFFLGILTNKHMQDFLIGFFFGQPHQTHKFWHMTSEAFKINHRATQNTPVLAHNLWGFQEQPLGHNLHILDFLIEHFGAGHTKYTSFAIRPVGLTRATTGSQFSYTGFFNRAFLCVPQFTYTGLFVWAFLGRPH